MIIRSPAALDEIASRNGEASIVEKIPESGVRIRDASNHLEILRKAAEHFPAVFVDFFRGRRGAVLGEHAAAGFQGLSGRRRFLGQLPQPRLERQTLLGCLRLQRGRLAMETRVLQFAEESSTSI